MIVICPECSTRYVVAAASISEEGRTVKCANCGHQWHQDPGKDKTVRKYEDETPDLDFDGLEEEQKALPEPEPEPAPVPVPETEPEPAPEESFDAIPDAVKPIQDEPDMSYAGAKKRARWMGIAGGYGAAAAVFALLIMVFGVMKNTVTSLWPATAIIYESFGADVAYAGEGLIFDRVVAKTESRDGYNVLNLSGMIINLRPEAVALPPILASLLNDDGETAANWIIDPGTKQINGEDSIPFSMEYELSSTDVTNARVQFLARMPETESAEDAGEEEHADAEHNEGHGGETHEEEGSHAEPEAHDDTHHEEPDHH